MGMDFYINGTFDCNICMFVIYEIKSIIVIFFIKLIQSMNDFFLVQNTIRT